MKKCQYCRLLQFRKEEAFEKEKGRMARSRFYDKAAKAIENHIGRAVRVSSLHPCSEEHRLEILSIRRLHSRFTRDELKEKIERCERARLIFNKAQSFWAECNLLHGRDDQRTITAYAKLTNAKTLLAQRQRRLEEARSKK